MYLFTVSTLPLLLLCGAASASPVVKLPLVPRKDMCYFDNPDLPVGDGHAICVGSNGKDHEDKLYCPLQPGAVDRICGRDDVDASVRDNCKAIDGTASFCTVGGPSPLGGHHQCYCIHGNFCCDHNAEVPGGDHPTKYFKQVGCNCGKEI